MNGALLQHSLAKFLIVGGVSTIINYGVYLLLHLALGYSYETSYVAGFLSGVVFSYGFNRAWTFQITSHHHTRHMWRYLSVYTLSLFIGLGCIKLAVDVFQIDPVFANMGAIIVTTCTNYAGIRYWAFKK